MHPVNTGLWGRLRPLAVLTLLPIALAGALLTGGDISRAIFVAFRPEWLLTYSDARYLPRPAA